MKKKLTRPKRNHQEVIRFVEDLPKGMVSSGKASDLVNKKLSENVASHSLGKKGDHDYLVDLMLGLNDEED